RPRGEPPRVEAGVRFGRFVAFDFVEHLQDGRSVGHRVDLSTDAPIVTIRGYRGGIHSKIEERGHDAPVPLEDQLRVDTRPAGPVERRHQGALEEDQLAHWRRGAAGPRNGGRDGVRRSSAAGVTSNESDTDVPSAVNAT